MNALPFLAMCNAGMAAADETSDATGARFGGPDAVPNQIERDRDAHLDWQKKLTEKGISFSVDYSAVGYKATEVLNGADDKASGGMLRFYGSWDAVEKGAGNSGSLIWKVEHRHAFSDTEPRFLNFNTGAQSLSTPPFSDEGARATNLYWRQRFNEGQSTVVAGLLDVTDFVDVYALASPWTGFLNFAFSTGTTTIALPGDATLGLAGATMLNDNIFIIGTLADMNSEPDDPLETFETFFDDQKYFKSVELGWTDRKSNIYTNNIHLTVWHADESRVQGTDDGWGINFSASRLIGAWLPFLRAGYSEDAGTLSEKSVSAGFGYLGITGPGSTLGLAANWSDVPGGSDQWTSELYYLWKPLNMLELTLNAQLVKDPPLNSDSDQSLIAGIRVRLVF